MSKFSERFKLLKEENNITLREISNELNITVPNLSYYMKGREPNYDTVMKIANYFEVTVDWLIGNTDYRTAQSKVNFSIIEDRINKLYNNDIKIAPSSLDKIDVLENKLIDTLLEAISNECKNNSYDNIHWREDIEYILDKFFDCLSSLTSIVYFGIRDEYDGSQIRTILFETNEINRKMQEILFKKMKKCLLDENADPKAKSKILFILENHFIDNILAYSC
ncbi:MAG: helix-turn-helix domain-containing protein [Clostridiales bacterium]|nr:helix-turn-helix domain-containing protein [Clostridiales bacterium]